MHMVTYGRSGRHAAAHLSEDSISLTGIPGDEAVADIQIDRRIELASNGPPLPPQGQQLVVEEAVKLLVLVDSETVACATNAAVIPANILRERLGSTVSVRFTHESCRRHDFKFRWIGWYQTG